MLYKKINADMFSDTDVFGEVANLLLRPRDLASKLQVY